VSARTGVRLPVETFALVRERRSCGISGPSDRDDINGVKVIALPFRHNGRIAAVSGEKFLGYSFDKPVLPSDQDKRIAIDRLFDGGLQPIGVGEAEARIDRQTEEYRSRLDRREGAGRNRMRLHDLASVGTGRAQIRRWACRRFWR